MYKFGRYEFRRKTKQFKTKCHADTHRVICDNLLTGKQKFNEVESSFEFSFKETTEIKTLTSSYEYEFYFDDCEYIVEKFIQFRSQLISSTNDKKYDDKSIWPNAIY